MVFEIPLSPYAQAFQMSFLGVTYRMIVQWRDNTSSGGWYLDIYSLGGDLIIGGIPMLTGADLLEQYDYLGFDVALYVQSTKDALVDPTYDNLGTVTKLYYVPS